MKFLTLFAGLLLLFCPYFGANGKGNGLLSKETKTGPSGNTYTFIYKNKAKMDFEITRPDPSNTSILLCIPAAFTSLSDYGIDGIYICKGKTGNRNAVNRSLGGGIRIVNGEGVIFPTAKGKLITDSLITEIEKQKGSLFQQIQMIVNGSAATFKDQKLFQRRGIALLNDGRACIAESVKAISLKTFADDLAALGVKDLLYTDMGAWDEGWYREADGKIVKLGYNHSQTDKQSNWVVFLK